VVSMPVRARRWSFVSRALAFAVVILVGAAPAYAGAITDPSAFTAEQTVITFDDAAGNGTTQIASQYAAQGATYGGVLYWYASTYSGFAWTGSAAGTAANFSGNTCPCFNDVTVTFGSSVSRAGFDAVTNSGDSIQLVASRNGLVVDDQTFSPSLTPSFVGVDVPGGFDSLVIHTVGPINGAFAMDDFRFEALVLTDQWAPAPSRLAACSVAGNKNPVTGEPIAPGTFLDLYASQVASDPHYAGATPPLFVEGIGLTCKAPPPGYELEGFAGDEQRVGSGYYPYWAAPAQEG